MKKFLTLLFFISISLAVKATHNRAGEITYRQIADLTYEFTITTYTREASTVDRPSLEVFYGDNTSDVVSRSVKVNNFGPDIAKNLYKAIHTYPGPSIYKISFLDANRNELVINIPSSVDVPFYVETILVINPFQGYNNSPVLQRGPIDAGCKGYPFIHNPGAYDPDGTDSLSYRLIKCKGAKGEEIPGYTFPAASRSFSLNSVTGDLIWDSPEREGEYNVAFIIEEWRNHQLIGSIERDMQIRINLCDTGPPVISPLPDICVTAGDPIQFEVKAKGPEQHYISLTATGSPLLDAVNPASFSAPGVSQGVTKGIFKWDTKCANISHLQQRIIFKATDVRLNENYVDFKNVSIRVVGPAPKNLTLNPVGNSIALHWDKNICTEAIGYKVYKRNSKYDGTITCPCTTGVPPSTGFTLIKTLNGYDNNTYSDDDNGNGLAPGTSYCYIVTALFKGNSESCPSNQNCAVLKKDLPIITHVSIQKTDLVNGQVYLAWSRPTELDTVRFAGPYTYVITTYDKQKNLFVKVDSTGFLDGLNDTVYIHKNINTLTDPRTYQVQFYSLANGKRHYIGKTQAAASVFLSIAPTDNRLNLSWTANVPWINTNYVIYRLNKNTNSFDSIGTSKMPAFSDTGLKDSVSFCYKVKTTGAYSAPGLINPIVNFSQEVCQAPVDNTPPCAPILNVYPDCQLHKNLLVWKNTNKSCSNDVLKYNIYYSPLLNGKMTYIASVNLATDTFFVNENMESIAGCYMVTASDSGKNESLNAKPVCVDNCPYYELPNIFTPNGDNVNEYFKPFPYAYIKDVDMTIYDRWGMIVFKTTDPDVKWEGKSQLTNKECADGVYFYLCNVHEIHYDGIHTKSLRGFVTLLKGQNSKPSN